jgi:hypothetical protein
MEEANSYLKEFQDSSYHIHNFPFYGDIYNGLPHPTMNSDETIFYYIWMND